MTMKTPWWRSDSPAPVYPQDEAWAGSGSVSVESEGPGGPLVSGLAYVPPSTRDVDGCTDVTDPCCTGGGSGPPPWIRSFTGYVFAVKLSISYRGLGWNVRMFEAVVVPCAGGRVFVPDW